MVGVVGLRRGEVFIEKSRVVHKGRVLHKGPALRLFPQFIAVLAVQ